MKTASSVLLTLTLSTLGLVGGCTAPAGAADPATDTSTAAYSNGPWQKLLTCNGGAAVLDVDSGERRNVQLVIRDRNIVDYLQSKSPDSSMVNASHEIVMQASEELIHGLFKASDFGADDFWTYRYPDFLDAAVIQRDGNGIKVTIAKRFDPICENGYWGYQGGCNGGSAIRAHVDEELANWYFDDCR